jgi:hypothetical protein
MLTPRSRMSRQARTTSGGTGAATQEPAVNHPIIRTLLAATLLLGPRVAAAQDIPLQVSTNGNVATVSVGAGSVAPIAELTFTFDDASNLSARSLGVTAQLVDLANPALLSRIPQPNLLKLDSALPLLVTVAAPASGGLSFRRTGRFELHTHLLSYSLGSNFRVLKAPVGGRFQDVTEEIAPGSVRARSRYSGFSQFLVVADLRPTSSVVAEKVQRLDTRVSTLPAAEQPAFDGYVDAIRSALGAGDYASAIAAVDQVSSRALERAGHGLADEWRASRDADNQAGDLLADAATLKFSIAYLRDYGD